MKLHKLNIILQEFYILLVFLFSTGCNYYENTNDIHKAEENLSNDKVTVKVIINSGSKIVTRGDEDMSSLYIYLFNVDKSSVCVKKIEFSNLAIPSENLVKTATGYAFTTEIFPGRYIIYASANKKLQTDNGDIIENVTKREELENHIEIVEYGTNEGMAKIISEPIPMVGIGVYEVKKLDNLVPVYLELERVYSKIEVSLDDNFSLKNLNLSDTYSKLSVCICNVPKKYMLFNKQVVFSGANFTINNINSNHLGSYYEGFEGNFINLTKAGSSSFYVPENFVKVSNDKQSATLNSVTYLLIRVQAVPSEIKSFTTKWINEYPTTPQTNLMLTLVNSGTGYEIDNPNTWLKTITDAERFYKYSNVMVKPIYYLNSNLYYRINLNNIDEGIPNGDRYHIRRNCYYKVKIMNLALSTYPPASDPGQLKGVGDQLVGHEILKAVVTVKPMSESTTDITLTPGS